MIDIFRALQILNTGIVPGNRNADNIDEKLSSYSYLLFLSRTIRTTGIRAALLKSFGFGQVGGEVLLIHPDYLLSALSPTQYKSYKELRETRYRKTFRYLHDTLIGLPMVQIKDSPPYGPELESLVYLNPAARASFDPIKETYRFNEHALKEAEKRTLESQLDVLKMTMFTNEDGETGIGVDVQLIGDLNLDNEEFLLRNFTKAEQDYCRKQADPAASFAGRWAAKEAIVKALCNSSTDRPSWLTGAGGSLKAIEILAGPNGSPQVTAIANITNDILPLIKLSISHSGSYALAIALIKSNDNLVLN